MNATQRIDEAKKNFDGVCGEISVLVDQLAGKLPELDQHAKKAANVYTTSYRELSQDQGVYYRYKNLVNRAYLRAEAIRAAVETIKRQLSE